MSSRDSALMILGILSFAFLSSLAGTIVAMLLSTIGSSLQSMQFSSWDGMAYLLSQTVPTPLFDQLATILGWRPSLLFAGTLFSVATVLCAFVQNMQVHVAPVEPTTNTVAWAQFTNLLWGFSAAVGVPLRGWLGDTIGWHTAFVLHA
ncbi:hypothetical protein DFH08DRAFT_1033956, partial [Mycena albidolilacea]